MLVIFGVEHNIITDGVMDLVVLLACLISEGLYLQEQNNTNFEFL